MSVALVSEVLSADAQKKGKKVLKQILLMTCMSACADLQYGLNAYNQDVIICEEVGCGGGQTYDDYLRGLPDVALSNEARALTIVSVVFGIDPLQILDVHFVPYDQAGLLCPGNIACAGIEVDCSIWLWWPDSQYTSGASADGPAISDSDYPYQIANCARRLRTFQIADGLAAKLALRSEGL